MPEARGTVSGPQNQHQVKFYGISTCVWCKRTRAFLEEQEVQFDFAYVDLLQGEEREAVMQEVRQWNPRASFPTVVVDDQEAVVGFRTEELKEVLGL